MTSREPDVRELIAVRDRLRRENQELRAAARSEQHRNADLFDAAPDAYLVTDGRGRIREANRAAEELLNVLHHYLIGKPLALYLGRFGALRQALSESRRRPVLPEREMLVTPRDGEAFEVGVTASTVTDAEGQPAGVRWLLRDIRERRRAEDEVRRLNAELEERVRARTHDLEKANQAKDALLRELERRARVERDFVTNAAHELRTPLAAILSAVEVLQSGAKDVPEELDRFLAHIEVQCRRLQRLAHSLLVLARAQMSQEPPRMERILLAPLLRDVAAAVSPADGVAVRVRCGSRTSITASRDLLEQALVSVAENAVRYATRGEIALTARSLDRNGTVRIEVRDTGPGMTPRDRDRAVERFHRGSDDTGDGFGLGLSIASQAVDVLGGELEIVSEPGEGTTVAMTLKRA